ncbi:class I SAM-dependent methyltransferase [Mesobacillus zeae]|uniref:Methyltransferase domain-containing protein n=1 Tax=Mesobacillus zeae TaxID=1917180 RepID=A0A398B514_9BACI|nr:class I SAM-dependent methyltransferase [Mesobacillus zeae]RID83050.1 methyltransferase domain-containing protein [Mesobacillus zeae]
MKLERILPFAKILLEKAVSPGDIVIDATVGNGHDTVFLADLVGENGKVFGFDIQEAALESCMEKLVKRGLEKRAALFKTGHQNTKAWIPPEFHGRISGAIFNLGYLPGGDKSIVTIPDTTIAAVEQIFNMLSPQGVIVIVIYHGHPEGSAEKDILLQYAETLPQDKAHVLRYQFINQKNSPPFIVAIEKR